MSKKDFKQQNAEALEAVTAPIEYEVDGVKVRLSPSIVKRFITKGQDITDAEYKYFIDICQARNLNPFIGEVHLIKFGTAPAQIVVGRDAFVKRAVKHPDYLGKERGVVVQKEDGSIEYRKGALVLDEEKLVGGWAKVHRKGRSVPTEVAVSLREGIQRTSSGQINSNWTKQPATMIEKVALVRALRDAFVEDLSGMYDRDEAWDNDTLNRTNPDEEEIEVVEETQHDPLTGEVVEPTEIVTEGTPVTEGPSSLSDL